MNPKAYYIRNKLIQKQVMFPMQHDLMITVSLPYNHFCKDAFAGFSDNHTHVMVSVFFVILLKYFEYFLAHVD